jgi:ornithine cyclodeaminase/alanine dehydrogenase-like protein (mu-crystallin family)
MPTLLIRRSDVQRLLNPADVLPRLRDGFIAYSQGALGRAKRVRSDLPGPGTATVLFPGSVPGFPLYSVKVHAKFPAQRPAIRGVLCLHSSETGELLAIMDSTLLTGIRTGLSGALAAHVLARPQAASVAVIGCGEQGRHQLTALATLRPINTVVVYDVVEEVARRYSEEMAQSLQLSIEPVGSPAQALEGADIALVATWARTPIITNSMVRPGTHVTTLGADEPSKAEVSRDLIEASKFFCDDRALACEMGALGGVGLPITAVAAELGEVLAGK